MSAWIVSKKHIDLLVGAALAHGLAGRRDTADELGAALWEENYASVNYRYADCSGRDLQLCPSYHYDPSTPTSDPVVLLKQLDCYEYQTCEHQGWLDSRARQLCSALRSAAIHSLPGYKAAPWGID